MTVWFQRSNPAAISARSPPLGTMMSAAVHMSRMTSSHDA